ncbi:Maf family protein [Peloplasma aerotolerans]|jgi:septum formation protein|uniref:dTTP/UTP pyrophosphatase n=1 Tax=Peloplasma aerotolerans TaxID=3044389 RepID=A0AAW6U5S0_9MOLU|nr:Maf family protein [Mariniplasma sp. M4Ah]MDI6452165.1 Maf family protein [Mariniplasma sp. M4Ah]
MLILASGSPRRAKLLKDAGLDFIVIPSHLEEVVDEKLKPVDYVTELAKMKAMHIAQDHPEDTVIGADTIVVYEEQILGKPIDEEDACRMLKLLSGDRHVVYTAVALIRGEKIKTFVSETEVSMKNLSDLEIQNYVKTKEPMDKAGAYGIQGEGGSLVDHYKGDFFTIVGLPLKELLEALKTF